MTNQMPETCHIFFCSDGRLCSEARSFELQVLLADQRGIEPPPAVCQRHNSAAILTEPRGRLAFITL